MLQFMRESFLQAHDMTPPLPRGYETYPGAVSTSLVSINTRDDWELYKLWQRGMLALKMYCTCILLSIHQPTIIQVKNRLGRTISSSS